MRTKIAFLFLILLLSSCTPSGGSTSGNNGQTGDPVIEPTVTSTPGVPLAILILPADMPQTQYDQYLTTVYNLAHDSGIRFQVRNTFSITDLEMELPDLKIVIAFPPDPGLTDLASAAPQVQFLGVGITGLTSTSNLSLIGASGSPIDRQAFLAGYMAALLAEDYRAGIITEEDTPGGEIARDAFINGYHFYCGLCNPAFPPYYPYPIYLEVPTESAVGAMTGYVDALHDRLVEVAYVYPKIATLEIIDYMAQYDLKIIGESLPLEDLGSNWVASIQPQIIPAIESIWPDLLAGKGGQDVPMPLFLTDINPELLTPGKQQFVEELLSNMKAGYIDTGVKP